MEKVLTTEQTLTIEVESVFPDILYDFIFLLAVAVIYLSLVKFFNWFMMLDVYIVGFFFCAILLTNEYFSEVIINKSEQTLTLKTRSALKKTEKVYHIKNIDYVKVRTSFPRLNKETVVLVLDESIAKFAFLRNVRLFDIPKTESTRILSAMQDYLTVRT